MSTPDSVFQSVYAAAAAAMAGQAGNPYAALSGAGANGAAGLLGIPGNPATAGSTSGTTHSKLVQYFVLSCYLKLILFSDFPLLSRGQGSAR